jgi:hypothetical protein
VVRKSLKKARRGRDGDCSPPPAQIPACVEVVRQAAELF